MKEFVKFALIRKIRNIGISFLRPMAQLSEVVS